MGWFNRYQTDITISANRNYTEVDIKKPKILKTEKRKFEKSEYR